MFETVLLYLSAPWVAPVIGVVIGWLALPQPGPVADSWWGKLIAPYLGNGAAASNVSAIISIVMSILKMNGAISSDEPAPDPKAVKRVMANALSVDDCAKNHGKLRMSLMKMKAHSK